MSHKKIDIGINRALISNGDEDMVFDTDNIEIKNN